MIPTSFAELDSPERLRRILAERGYFPDEAPADKLFGLPPDQIGLLQGARIIALAGPSPDNNTLVVLWIPRPSLPVDVLRRIRRKLAENTHDGLIFCVQSWQKVTLYLLRQEDVPQAGQEPAGPDKVPDWEDVNFSALRPADRQGLALLDIHNEDPYDLGKVLLRAFRRATRETIYQNQGLFSNYYLNERLEFDNEAHNSAWRALAAEMPALRTTIEAALAAGVDGLDLAQTEASIIDPLLSVLGWKPATKNTKGQIDLLLGGVTIAFCRILPWNTPLDIAPLPNDLFGSSPPSPDMQLIGKLSGQKNVLWGILTNGRVWRLLSRQAASTSGVFYEIDLQDLLEIGATDGRDLRWFAAFFGAEWLRAPNGQPGLLDVVYQSGQFWAEKLGNDLKAAIFKDVFVDLANALAEGVHRTGQEPDLRTVYRATLVLLYRLLFVLYAESRKLLPRATASYYPNSLTYLLSTLALKQNGLVSKERDFSLQPDDPRLWRKLRALFHAISEGNVQWNVLHYNGGLFADDTSPAHQLLASLDNVANDYLTDGLDRLARDAYARDAKTENDALRLIDYIDLDVRRLGSIYEGLLEFQLRRADEHGEVIEGRLAPVPGKKGRKHTGRIVQKGEVYLETTRQDRKASGSYYTPDYIVRYIVEQTIGPVLEQHAVCFNQHMDHARSIATSIKRSSDSATIQHLRDEINLAHEAAIEALLDLKVLDPAMGSGHFLVAAVNYLSDQISAILERYPENPIQRKLAEVRAAIRQNLDAQGIAGAVVPDEQLSDRVLLRRMVMKRCIYGVDLDDMAVELSKLSLWLDSFAIGAPLSFLDHHLRWGNSLIGIWDVEQYIDPTSQHWSTFMRALGYMVKVTHLTDSTNAEVQESKVLYDQAQRELQPFREQLNVDLAVHFAALGDVSHARRVAHTTGADREQKHAPESIAKFQTAQQEAETRRFFHWKLEFPEVFVDHKRSAWKADGVEGFDAVVGNPPYDILKRDPDNPLLTRFIDYIRKEPEFKTVLSSMLNIFHLMMKRSISLVCRDKAISMIVPLSFLSDYSSAGIRKTYIHQSSIEDIQAFPQKDDPNNRVFRDAKLSTMIFVARIGAKTTSLRCRVHPGKEILDSSPEVVIHIHDIERFDRERLTVPIGTPEEANILAKFYTDLSFLPFNSYFNVLVGEIDMTLDRDCVEAHSGNDELLKGAHLQRFLQRTQPKQGEREWVNICAFNAKYGNTTKANVHKHERVAFQAITGTDDSRRLKATLVPSNYFLANSLNYFSLVNRDVNVLLSLALINSQLFEWRFRLTSVNNNVNNYEIHAIPIRHIHFHPLEAQRKQLADEIGGLAQVLIKNDQELTLCRGATGWPRYAAADYRATLLGQRIADLLPQDAQGNFLAFAEGATGEEEHSDAVHDLLAELAGRMIELNKQKQHEIKRFLGWLEERLDITPDKKGRNGIDSLDNKTVLHNYLGDYQKKEDAQPWESMYAVLHKNRRRFVNDYWLGDTFRPQLQAEYKQSLNILEPIKAKLARTDALIDQIVYQLYGLTLADIAVVEGA